MPTFSNIAGEESSTVTFRLASVNIVRGSTTEKQEIVCLGDPDSSVAIGAVLATAPASTAWGLAVRLAGGPSSAADCLIQTQGNSTVVQGTTPWTIAGNSTVFIAGPVSTSAPAATDTGVIVRQVGYSTIVSVANTVTIQGNSTAIIQGNSTVIQGTSPWVVGFQAGNISTTAQTGNSSGLTVRPVWSSSNADQPVSIAGNSTAVIASGNSSVIITSGNSSVTISAFGSLVSSNVQAGNSSALTVRNVWSSTNADQPVSAVIASGNSSVIITSGNSSVIITSGNSSVTISAFASLVSSNVQAGNSSALTVRNVWSSTNADQPVSATLNLGALQSSVAGSSNSSALLVRPIIDGITTVASTNAFASTSFTVQSSGAGIRTYVTAYSILSTNAGPSRVKFYDGTTMIWPVVFAAVSSAVSGANLAVTPPGYLFRGSVAAAMTLQLASSLAGFQVAVSYYRAP